MQFFTRRADKQGDAVAAPPAGNSLEQTGDEARRQQQDAETVRQLGQRYGACITQRLEEVAEALARSGRFPAKLAVVEAIGPEGASWTVMDPQALFDGPFASVSVRIRELPHHQVYVAVGHHWLGGQTSLADFSEEWLRGVLRRNVAAALWARDD